MAVAFDVATSPAAWATATTQSTSHAGSASAKGVIVMIVQAVGITDQISGVTYGGVAMRRMSFIATPSGGEPGAVYMYVLEEDGSGRCQGTKSCAITSTGTSNKVARIATVTAATASVGFELAGSVSSSSVSPQWTSNNGLQTGMRFAAEYYGANALVATAAANNTFVGTQLDMGNFVAHFLRSTTEQAASPGIVIGPNSTTADDVALQIINVFELALAQQRKWEVNPGPTLHDTYNTDFTTDVSGWTASGAGTGTLTRSTALYAGGAGLVDGNTASVNNFRQWNGPYVACSPGETVQMTARVNVTARSGGARAYITVAFFDSSNVYLGQTFADFRHLLGEQRLMVSAAAPAGTAKCQLFFGFNIDGAAGAITYHINDIRAWRGVGDSAALADEPTLDFVTLNKTVNVNDNLSLSDSVTPEHTIVPVMSQASYRFRSNDSRGLKDSFVDAIPTATKFASPTGNDTTGDGSSGNPWRSLNKLATSLGAGECGELAAGTYDQLDGSGRVIRLQAIHDGTRAQPKWIKAASGATVTVRGDWNIDADWWRFHGLKVDLTLPTSTSPVRVSPNTDTTAVNFIECDFTGQTQNFQGWLVGSGTPSIGYFLRYLRCRFFNIGGTTNAYHAIYASKSQRLLVEDCLFKNVGGAGGRGIQIYPDSDYATVRHCVFDAGSGGVVFGNDATLASSDAHLFERNIFSNLTQRAGINETWSGGTPPGGSVTSIAADNHFHNNTIADIQAPQMLSVSGSTSGDPLYTDAANNDYSLQGGSPAAGKGIRATPSVADPNEQQNLSINAATKFRVRFELQETGGIAGSIGYHLYASKNGGSYARVTTATDLRVVASAQYADGDPCSVKLLTTGTGAYVPGAGDEDAAIDAIAIVANGNTELEWTLQIEAASLADTFDLRVYRADGQPLDSYAVTPRVTAASGTGGTAHEVFPADTVAVSDSVSDEHGAFVGVADTAALSDDTSRSSNKAAADTATVADSVSRLASLSASDAVGVADNAIDAHGIQHSVTPTDSVVLADSASTNRGVIQSAADTANVADSATTSEGHAASAADTAAVADSASKDVHARSSDTLALADSQQSDLGVGHIVNVGDTAALADSAVAAQGVSIPVISDTVAVSDDEASQIVKAGISDVAAVADSSRSDSAVSVADAAALADTASNQSQISAADVAGVADAQRIDLQKAGLADVAGVADASFTTSNKVSADAVAVADDKLLDFTKSASDSATVADSQQSDLGLGHVVNVGDSVAVNDSAASHVERTGISDTIGVNDAVAPELSFGSTTFDDAAAVSDAVSTSVVRSVADAAATSDASQLTINKAASDIGGVADSVSTGRVVGASDAAAVADSSSTAAGWAEDHADAAGVADASRSDVQLVGSDFVPVSDSMESDLGIGHVVNVGDSLGLSDSSFNAVAKSGVNDPVAVSDSSSWYVARLASDAAAVADAASVASDRHQIINDPIALADSATTSRSIITDASDTAAVADLASTQANMCPADAIPLDDSFNRAIGSFIADTASLADFASNDFGGGLRLDVSDSLTLSDLTAMDARKAGLNDTAPSIDAVALAFAQMIADVLVLNDSFQTARGSFATASDNIAVSDAFTRLIARTVSDAIGVADDRSFAIDITPADALDLLDNFTTVIIGIEGVPNEYAIVVVPEDTLKVFVDESMAGVSVSIPAPLSVDVDESQASVAVADARATVAVEDARMSVVVFEVPRLIAQPSDTIQARVVVQEKPHEQD